MWYFLDHTDQIMKTDNILSNVMVMKPQLSKTKGVITERNHSDKNIFIIFWQLIKSNNIFVKKNDAKGVSLLYQ